MPSDNILEKTNRINLLFDFYQDLLTERQQLFLRYYFHDNYSLGEIAQEFDISRQAVYEHIKRAETILESYEHKLRLLAKHEKRMELLKRMEKWSLDLQPRQQEEATAFMKRLSALE